MTRSIAIFIFLLIFFQSCRSVRTEKVEVDCKLPKKSLEEVTSGVRSQIISFDYMAVRAKVDYDDGVNKQSFTANIRMRQDSLLWVLFSGTLSYEGARFLASTDSLWITNRLEKIYHQEPIESLDQFIPIGLDLILLQDIVAGNPFKDSLIFSEIRRDPCQYVLIAEDEQFEWEYSINPENYTVASLRLKDKIRYRELIASFEDYQETPGGLIPMSRYFEVNVKGNSVKITAQLSRLKIDEELSFPFKINPNYEKVELEK